MATNSIDAGLITKMFLAGAKNLEAKKEWINELNVFPVPDGDTGTNMTMTIMSAAKEVRALSDSNDIDMASLCKAISSGSLRGARGNSGVILSQLLRGFTKEIKEHDEVTLPILADAFDRAVETAYKAVMKPKEGTILTVAKGGAKKARELANNNETDIELFINSVIEEAEYVLSQTPEMLPVLKQAGVVDSGGQGLLEVLKGARDAFYNKEIDISIPEITPVKVGNLSTEKVEEDIKFGYCTEFIILLNKTFNIKSEMDFKEYLESIGDSIVCVADEDVVKVHVHTNDPGLAIQKALKYGALSNMKIDNMRLEHQEKLFKESEKAKAMEESTKEPEMEHKTNGFVAVSIGEGMNEIFKDLGADYIIEGGQTMNPSTEDMLNAIEKVNADNVFILPNNKNIILAANQAASLVDNKNIIVLPTKTVPQGITALINFLPDGDAQTNEETMKEAIATVKTGQVTYAVRDTSIDDKEIKQGDFMGIGDTGILSVGKDRFEVTLEMVDAMVDESTELVSIYYGDEVTEEDANSLKEKIEEKYPSCDVELQNGGQPIYYFVISVE